MGNCKPRRILLVNSDRCSAEDNRGSSRPGLPGREGAGPGTPVAAWRRAASESVFLDAASLGDEGPELVEVVNRQAPHARIVVVGSPAARGNRLSKAQDFLLRRRALRRQRDRRHPRGRIPNPRDAAGQDRTAQRPLGADQQHLDHQPQRHKVQLLAAPGLLWGNEGLGQQIGQKLLAQMFPVVVTPGETQLTPANILKTAGDCDRLMVLLAGTAACCPAAWPGTRSPTSAWIPERARTR